MRPTLLARTHLARTLAVLAMLWCGAVVARAQDPSRPAGDGPAGDGPAGDGPSLQAVEGQQAAEAPEAPPLLRFEEQTSVAWVLVPTTVRRRGAFVEGLEAADFRLRVDGRTTPIESFDAQADAPISLVFLQDLSGSMANGGKLEAGRLALDCLIERAVPGDTLVLASFSVGRTEIDVPFTYELDVLSEAADLWRPWGTTALHDAVAWIPEIQLGAGGGRTAALLVTDGVDNASRLDPAEARAMVRAAEVPVYVLALRGSGIAAHGEATLDDGLDRDPVRQRARQRFAGRQAAPAPRAPTATPGDDAEAALYATLLRRLATSTGGRYVEVERRSDVTALCHAMLEELRSLYLLGFQTAAEATPAEEPWHSVVVELPSRPRTTVEHRAGYRGRPPLR